MQAPDWAMYDYSGDVGPGIYGQFYWYHYFLPWFSKQVVCYQEYMDTCGSCPCLTGGYSKECPFGKRRQAIEDNYAISARDVGGPGAA
ncbi:MAG: hypothetical protein AB1505_10530 [Candidatus Latescibacterota bacterium]